MNKSLAVLGLVGVLAAGCSSLPRVLTPPERATIDGAGGQVDLLQGLLQAPNNEKIDALLIFKDGELVLERYANGYDAETPHDLRSATKAITALLVGIAIDQGLIPGVDQGILDYFPEQRAAHPLFQAIRIQDLLSMSSGLESDDWVPSSVGNEERMYATSSWVNFFFSLPVVDRPGTRFRYSTAGVVVLGEILKRASGLDLATFADRYLFRRLGIEHATYARTPAGEIDAGGHLRMTPRDFAKIGLLMLRGGRWGETQVVSESWVRQLTRPQFLIPGAAQTGPFLGYLWWQEPVVDGEVRSYQARGNGGQYLITVPSEGLLGVFTGSAFNDNQQLQPFLLMKNFVIPAFRH